MGMGMAMLLRPMVIKWLKFGGKVHGRQFSFPI